MSCSRVQKVIYKGDDTGANGQEFLRIYCQIPTGYSVSKIAVCITNLEPIEFENPVFPLVVNLTSDQTLRLSRNNTVTMIAYDEDGLQTTCEGIATFIAKDRR